VKEKIRTLVKTATNSITENGSEEGNGSQTVLARHNHKESSSGSGSYYSLP
jgi:hypothetical protein